jgi:S-adenosylmethionine:tRNA ribosyltransferase-isomerase
VEVFLLEETKFDGKICWQVLTHPTRRVKEGETLYLGSKDGFPLHRKFPDGKSLIKFKSRAEAARLISKYGHVPLPVYIHRPDQKSDITRYQTVYANPKKDRSVAAPTAGLHFTKSIMEKIETKGIKIIPITLHVGYGTFKSVKADNIDDHIVDPEFAEISKTSARILNKVRKNGGKIFAVGTTSARTLESAKITDNEIQPLSSPVDLYIKPGHEFRVVDHMITNFHLPKSSLIIMVSAFAGRENILGAYKNAIKENYNFYSYGDCMVII